jgi:thioredoxin 1
VSDSIDGNAETFHIVTVVPVSGGRNIAHAPSFTIASNSGEDDPMATDTNSLVKHINDGDFDSAVLKSATPVLIDFWAPWCGPCRMIGPIVDELSSEYQGKVSMVKINVDENPMVAQQFGVSSIPTLMLFKGGQLADRVLGALPKAELKRFIDRNV